MIRSKSYSVFGDFDFKPLPPLVCDDIVDKSNFRPDSYSHLSLSAQGSSVGSFDYPDGTVSVERTPTDVEIAIRNGKLSDRADLAKAQELLSKDAQDIIDESASKSAKAKADKIAQARQAVIDESLGFVPDSVSDSE